MLPADAVLRQFRRTGHRLVTGVPCSYLTPLIDACLTASDLRYVAAANDGDAVAIGAGAALGGWPAVVMCQNSGLGNAVDPLTSLTSTFRLPVLLITTWRGEPGGPADELQHEVMGAITEALLDLLGVPHELFPGDEPGLAAALDRAARHMQGQGLPYALLLREGLVQPLGRALPGTPERAVHSSVPGAVGKRLPPDEALAAITAGTSGADVVVATTGYSGRALAALGDRDNQLHLLGSMGCASSFGLGLALAQPKRRVIVIDGDGAMLMRLGALATIGCLRPPNLVHVLLDNAVHDSTGGQATVSPAIDLALIAAGCGYPRTRRVADAAALKAAVAGARGELTFLHVRTAPRAGGGELPRPALTPPELARRLQGWMAAHG